MYNSQEECEHFEGAMEQSVPQPPNKEIIAECCDSPCHHCPYFINECKSCHLPKQTEDTILSDTELDPETKEEGEEIRRVIEEEKWAEDFKKEFGIHFKDSIGELQFAIEFISETISLALQERDKSLLEKIEKWNPKHWNEQSLAEMKLELLTLIKQG